jgi:RNA polymerase sigma factor (sigma-70 family)
MASLDVAAGRGALTHEQVEEVHALVWAIVHRRFRVVPKHVADPDDLYQYGMEGVARAARRFDPERSEFSAWAATAAHHAIQDALRSLNRGSRVGQQLHYGPSLDTSLGEDYDYATFADLVPDEPTGDPDLTVTVDGALASLTPKQRVAIRLRFWHDMRLRDVGESMGISESGACRLVRTGMLRMRPELAGI